MTIEEYFGDWMKVIDKVEMIKIVSWLKTLNTSTLCPTLPNVFKAFELCSYNKCKVIMIFQDPYPQFINNNPVATGIPIGNANTTPDNLLSPSLEVLKEAAIDYTIPHNSIIFDNSLESWSKQGILMLNSALTCEKNKVGSHVDKWRLFISKLIKNLSDRETGLVFILFGKQAQSLKPYINKSSYILEENHPAYYARNNTSMPNTVFKEMNQYLKNRYNITINLFKEYENY